MINTASFSSNHPHLACSLQSINQYVSIAKREDNTGIVLFDFVCIEMRELAKRHKRAQGDLKSQEMITTMMRLARREGMRERKEEAISR